MRLALSEEKVLSARSVLEVIFPNPKTRAAATIFVQWLSGRGGRATKNAVSVFANDLEEGKFLQGRRPLRYSRRNFYMSVLRTLIDLGFIRRNVPLWDDASRRTLYVYQGCIFDIPQKPPSIGFWRIAYYVCKKWNDMFTASSKGSEVPEGDQADVILQHDDRRREGRAPRKKASG